MKAHVVLALALAALAPGGASAEVVDSSAGGFTVRIVQQIAAAPAEVFRRFVEVGGWWSPQHTFSGDARNLSLEAKPGGCFCEKLPEGGGVRHMVVVNVVPGKTLVLSGALGPLQSLAATGTMTVQFAPDGAATRLTLTYSVAGYLPAGMNTWAAPVDGVLAEQIARLRNSIEKGAAAK